jgi:hypothetical protein
MLLLLPVEWVLTQSIERILRQNYFEMSLEEPMEIEVITAHPNISNFNRFV